MEVTTEVLRQIILEVLQDISSNLENSSGTPRGAHMAGKDNGYGLDAIGNNLSLPGVLYNDNPMTNDNAVAQEYIQIPYVLLKDALSAMKQATDDANTAAGSVNDAIDLANEKAQHATEQGDYANNQGDYAKGKGDYANEKGAYAKGQGDYANEKGTYAKNQGDYANEQGTYAKNQGDYAKAQGDYAKGQGDRVDNAIEICQTAVGEANNVNAQLVGMTVTITNRDGQSTSVNIGFEVYATYESIAAMKADAANVPAGRFVMIATTDKTSEENAQLYARNTNPAGSNMPFTFLSDLDQASSSAWADWLNNKKPLIEQATIDANNAAALANEKAGLAESIYNTVRTWYYGSDNNGFKATVESWIANTQTAWDNWFSDSLATGVRKLWNDFWANINSKWTNFFGEEDGTPTKGVQKTWTDWFTGRATDWNNYKDAKDTDWRNYKSGKDTDWNNYKDGKDTDWNSYKGGKDTDWGTYKGGKDTIWDNWFGTDDTSGVQKQWKDTKADAIAATTNANEKAGLANEKALYADNMASHPPYIADGSQSKPGDIGYVYHWDYANQTYVKGLRLSLDWSTMDANEKAAIEQDILNAIGFDETPTENSEHAVTSRGLYAALLLKQDNLDFADDEDAEAIWKDYAFTTTD